MTGPLAHWRVLDLTDLRGALCGRILADLGADVVLARPPGHDLGRAKTTAYRYRHANKRGTTLDVGTGAGHEELQRFLAGADVLIENLGSSDRSAAGLEPDAVAAAHPRLIHVALSDFGLDGPRAQWHLEPLTALAASGTLFAAGFPDRPPCWIPGHLAHDCASVYGAVGAVAAMMDRARTGRGQVVEVSVQEAGLAGTIPWAVALQDYLKINPFLPAQGTRNADGTYWVLPASDGYVRTVIGNGKQWRGFLSLLRDPEVLSEPEWKDPVFRIMNGDVVRMIAAERLADRTRAQLFAEGMKVGATLGVLHTPTEYVEHEQTRARRVFAESGFPGIETAPFVAPPLRLSATPAALVRPAPEGDGDAHPWPVPSPPAPTAGPEDRLLLEGVLVVEFGMAAVVPELSMVLSELGADVVKIESEAHVDVLRSGGMRRINCSFAFNAECRGRRSVALNLDTEEGRRLAFSLCARADVVAENYRGGVLERMGLGYEAVKEANPSVVYATSQGFGREGPFAEVPAYGPLNLGFVGLHGLWNHPDVPYPCGTSLNHPDHVAGKMLAVGVLAALDHRARTGVGQLVDMAQTDVAAFLLGEVYLDAFLTGTDPPARGNASDDAVPHGVYPAAGEDAWLAVAVPDDAAWSRLCAAAGWPADTSLATLPGRLAARETIDARMAEWSRSRLAVESAGLLQKHDVSAMPVMGPQDHLSDVHLGARNFIVSLRHPEVGDERHAGNPLRMSRRPQRTAASAPCLGADTEDVLTSLLGLEPAEVTDLVSRGVCA